MKLTPYLSRAVLAAILAAPLSASADPKQEAQEHIAKAMEAHGQNNFEVALSELQAAYALDPMPDLLFAIGQVYVKLDRCPDAIASYEQFLATNPGPQPTADTRQAIETCKKTEAEKQAQKPKDGPFAQNTGPGITSPPPPPVTTPTDTGPAPWYKDKLGGALVITGVAAGAASLVFYVGARGDLDDAEAATTQDAYRDLVDSAHSKRTMSVVFGVAGGVLLGAGVARYVMVKGRSSESRVGVVPTRGGGLVTWSGGF